MKEHQRVHIAMVNSFNILTKRATFGQILCSDIPMIAHDVNADLDEPAIVFMIKYFEDIEMFEKCMELRQLISNAAKYEDSPNPKLCQCEFPSPIKYSNKTKCDTCKKQISI